MRDLLDKKAHNWRVKYSINIIPEVYEDTFKLTVFCDNEAYGWNIMIDFFDLGTLIEKCTNRATKTFEFTYKIK